MNKFWGILILCGMAVSVSAQGVGIDIEAQRESVRSSILSWQVLSWVLGVSCVAWVGAYFISSSRDTSGDTSSSSDTDT